MSKFLTNNTIEFDKAYDVLTVGMRLAYMDSAGIISLDTTIPGEEELTAFALELSNGFEEYHSNDPDVNWDEYIETKIIEEYGRT